MRDLRGRGEVTARGWRLMSRDAPKAKQPFALSMNFLEASRALVSSVARTIFMLLLTLVITQNSAALAAPTVGRRVLSSGWQQPAVGVHTADSLSDDLSAAVRIHRGGRHLDVWLITPLSMHWDAIKAATDVPQIAAHQSSLSNSWRHDTLASEPARFERLPAKRIRPRIRPRVLPASTIAKAFMRR